MSSTNGKTRSEPGVSTAQAAAARCLAGAIVGAFEACAEGRMPLTQLQKVAIVESALLEFDGLRAHLRSLDGVERALLRLNGNARTG